MDTAWGDAPRHQNRRLRYVGGYVPVHDPQRLADALKDALTEPMPYRHARAVALRIMPWCISGASALKYLFEWKVIAWFDPPAKRGRPKRCPTCKLEPADRPFRECNACHLERAAELGLRIPIDDAVERHLETRQAG